MADFNIINPRVINFDPKSVFRGAGLIAIAIVVAILLFASIASVKSGHVGVLTLFGRVTGEALSEGIHLVNPFKVNHEMSIRTQEVKESASVPSSEGLVINLDTSLIFNLNRGDWPPMFIRK